MDSKEERSDFFEILPLFEEFISENNVYYKFDSAEREHCESLIKELVVKWGNKIKSATSGSNAENQINDILNELQRKIGDAFKKLTITMLVTIYKKRIIIIF